MSAEPIASVVIPAHDEQAVIGDTLSTLLADAELGELDVVVVCNGCVDATAQRARQVAGVRVVEIAEASKIAALRQGDEVTSVFPRIYLDADVALSTNAARALAAALADEQIRIAGVLPEVDLTSATRLARWYHEFRLRLPVYRHGIIGAGVYALDEQGRSRFGRWPEVTGDDQYVFRMFAADERRAVSGHRSRVRIDGGLRDVVRRGVRIRRGNRELTVGGPHAPRLPPPRAGIRAAVRATLREPRAWPGMLVWTLVNIWIRLRVRLRPDATGDWRGPADRRSGTEPPAG